MNIFKRNNGRPAVIEEKQPPDLPNGDLSVSDLNVYLAKVGQFTALLPAIMEGVKQLTTADELHLTTIRDFQDKLTNIFHDQEEITRYSMMVLEASREYNQVILETEETLKALMNSFEESQELNQKLTNGLEGLSEISQQFQNVVSLMADMSLTISQLSRNAEIKAFHAGNTGRGFGVIAENMNKLSEELREIAGQAPLLDAGLKEKINKSAQGLNQAKELAAILKDSSSSMEFELGEVYSVNQQIVKGFQEITKFSEYQSEISSKLTSGIEKISEITAHLGINQEVVASVLSTETANVRQIEFISGQIEKAMKIWQQKKDRRNLWELAIKLKLVQSTLEFSGNRWQGLQESVMGLKRTAQQEEKISAQVWSELEKFFGNIDGIGNELEQVEKKLGSVIERANQLLANVRTAAGNLKLLQKILDDFKNICSGISQDLVELQKIGQGVESFAEQVKLLAFYAAVEVTEMGSWSKELEPIISQTKKLALQAEIDSSKMPRMFEELNNRFSDTVTILDRNILVLTANLADVVKADASLNRVLEETQRFSGIGEKAKTGIDCQKANRNQLVEVYSKYAGSYQNVSYNLETIQRLFKQAHEYLLGFDQLTGSLFGQIDENIFAEDFGETLNLILPSDPITLDPAMLTDATSGDVTAHIFDGLVQFDARVNILPAIAANWTISDDGLVWTFNIRKGVKFHNGREVTADDVRYSLERLLDKTVNSPNSYFLDMIEGANDFREGGASYVKGIRVIDPYNLVIKLETPFMPFLANLATGITAIVPKEAIMVKDSKFNSQPVGTGPYKIKDWNKGEKIELERFDDYYEQKTSIKNITFHVNIPDERKKDRLEKMEIDQLEVRGREREEISKNPNCIVESVSLLNVQYIGINLNMATPFVDKRVRQAINHAIDKQYVINASNLKGEATVANGVFPPGLAAYNPDLKGYNYDPETAGRLLNQAGYSKGLPGEYLLDVRNVKDQIERAELIAKYCSKIGINIKPNPLPWGDLLDRSYQGKSILSMKGWSSDNGDPDNFLYPLFHSKNWGMPGNTSYYKSQKIDDMLTKALSIRNPIERLDYYRKIEEIIVEDAPWVFLFYTMKYVATNAYVQGFRIRPMGAARLKDCWIDIPRRKA